MNLLWNHKIEKNQGLFNVEEIMIRKDVGTFITV
jgi:hypothetical protein